MQLIVITPSNTRITIDTSGFDHAVKYEAFRRISPGEMHEEFDQIELDVPGKKIHFRDTSIVRHSTYSYAMRLDAATVLYQHYKDMFLREFQFAELAAFSERNAAAN